LIYLKPAGANVAYPSAHAAEAIEGKATGMTVKIGNLMAKRVFSAAPHHKVGYLRGIMARREPTGVCNRF